MISADPLVALAAALAIDRPALVGVELPDGIRHQFSVPLAPIKELQPATIQAAIDEYGDSFSLDFRAGDLIEITIDSRTAPDQIIDFVARASSGYDVVLRVDKTRLLRGLGLLDPDRETRLYLFTDALCALLQRGLAEFESELWRLPSRPLRIYVADCDASLKGPWLAIAGLGEPSTEAIWEEDEAARSARVLDQRNRFIGWDEQWVQALTPAHLRLDGETGHPRLGSLVHGQFVALAILFLCDRARSRTGPDGIKEIRAEFRGQAHVTVIPLIEGAGIEDLGREELKAISALVEWVYSIDETTERDWVADRLPFVQTRVAQLLEGRPEEARLAAFTTDARYLIEGLEWQWKAFIEGRISAYLENRKDLEALIGDTVVTFRERASDLVKGLSDNMLAAVGVLVGSFIAAAFADPFNEDLFRIGIIVYGIYLLVFPGLMGMLAHSVRFASAHSDFDERISSYQKLLGSEVDKLVGSRVANATRDYWIATVVVALLYVVVGIAAFYAADKVPSLINARSKSSEPASSAASNPGSLVRSRLLLSPVEHRTISMSRFVHDSDRGSGPPAHEGDSLRVISAIDTSLEPSHVRGKTSSIRLRGFDRKHRGEG